MKKIIGLFILLSVMACSPSTDKSDTQSSKSEETTVQQIQPVEVGEASINLPHIDGMTEGYSNPDVKKFANQFNVAGNTLLAFYLENDTYKRADKLGTFPIDDYFQILVPNVIKNIKAGPDELDGAAKEISSVFITDEWDGVEKLANKKINEVLDNVSLGKPTVLEQYSPNNDAHTIITLMKVQAGNKQIPLVMTTNVILVKEKLLFLNYYKTYQNDESVKAVKAKNDDIVLKLVNVNK